MPLNNNDLNIFFNYELNELKEFFINNNIKGFLATQIYQWVYKKYLTDVDLMHNISNVNKTFLKTHFSFPSLKIVKLLEDKDETVKFLFELKDGNKIESVIMKFDYGNSLCISSQVGCNMGCKFCASGQLKKVRNLEAYEMVLQVYEANKYLIEHHKSPIRNIVVMGIGEPLDNYENLSKFLNIVRNDLGIGIGSRKITVSTCGLVNKLMQFTQDFPQVGLAISLHAPNNELRNQLMPINHAFDIHQLIATCKQIIKLTNRRITFEYIMLKNVNDSIECAQQLGALLKDVLCYVNLIPYNEVHENPFKRSTNIKPFIHELKKFNVIVTVRQEKGANIDGACGQLRAKNLNK